MHLQIPEMWLGSESSFAEFLLRHSEQPSDAWMSSRMLELESFIPPAGRLWGGAEAQEEEQPRLSYEDRMALELIEVYGSVGVIEVKGSLVDDESPMNEWFGDVGYPTIARAAGFLVEDPGISHILVNYATGGGSANGIGEASDSLIAAGKVKPLHSFTGSSALSAGYWLAVTGETFRGSKMSQGGSVGAVAAFASVHRMLKERGIDAYVARSTPEKAVPHPMEPLSEKGKNRMDEQVKALHGFFTDHVLAQRPQLSSSGSMEGWASGAVFFAQEAMSLGMMDGPPITINELVAQLHQANLDSQETGDDPMPKHVVLASEQDRARLSAGLDANTVLANAEAAAALAGGGVVATPGDPNVASPDGSGVILTDPQEGDGETSTESQAALNMPATIEAGARDDLAAYLREEVDGLKAELKAEKDAHAVTLSVVADLRPNAAGRELLRPLAQTAVERLQIVMGHRPMPVTDLPDSTLVKMFDDLQAELSGLPTGQQSIETEASPRATAEDAGAAPSLASRRLHAVHTN